MKFQYAPELVEEVVFQEIQRRTETGDLRLFQEYHHFADGIYDDRPGNQREAAFDQLHKEFFVKLGFGNFIYQAIVESHLQTDKVEQVFVGKALSQKEEGADVGKDGRGIGIKLRTERFFDLPFLQRYLRHELMHIADLLDEAFGYEYHTRLSLVSPTEENIIRERYRVLWDISIDSRILRSGKETVSDKSQRFREFAALYRKLPEDYITCLFEGLWNTERFTHRELLDMAQDVQQLLARFPYQDSNGEVANPVMAYSHTPQLPGAPCPLCRFPTYAWLTDVTRFTPSLQGLVMEDFPHWHLEQGMCERCFEGYQVRANSK